MSWLDPSAPLTFLSPPLASSVSLACFLDLFALFNVFIQQFMRKYQKYPEHGLGLVPSESVFVCGTGVTCDPTYRSLATLPP